MNWRDYDFIYKDSLGRWNTATNPEFIAEHTCCRAIKKGEQPIKDLLKRMNEGVES